MNAPEMLPHGYPFLFIDKVIELEENTRAVCLKNLTADSPLLRDTLCKTTSLPWTLIIEAMAQTSGLLLNQGRNAFVAEIKNVKIQGIATAGDSLKVSSKKIMTFDRLHIFESSVIVKEYVIAKGEIVLAEF